MLLFHFSDKVNLYRRNLWLQVGAKIFVRCDHDNRLKIMENWAIWSAGTSRIGMALLIRV
jgi:hypothetical protein